MKFKRLLLILLVGIIAIQFLPARKNTFPATSNASIQTAYTVPADVQQILAVACNDCHTNNTRYPWYNKVQPVAWYLANHVSDGKRHLNLDSFATYTLKKQADKMEEFVEVIEKDEMPLSSYTLIHKDARLSAEQKEKLINGAKFIQQQINTGKR